MIRQVSAATGIINTVVGNRTCGYDGGGTATDHSLCYPGGLTPDANGNLFVADTGNHLLRWLAPGETMTTFVGTGTGAYNGDGGHQRSERRRLHAVGQVLPCCGQVAPAAMCTLIVYFTPSAVGKESATLQLYDSSATNPQTLPLTGTGTN